MKSRKIIFLSLLVMLMMACSLTSTTDGSPSGQDPVGDDSTSTNPVPVSLNDGLASLNSYEMTVIFMSIGPDPSQSSTTTIERQRSNDDNTSLTVIRMSTISPGGGESSTVETFIYQVGYDQCTGSDTDGWSWTSSTPAEAELQGLITSMVGLTPLIDDPVFVASETLIGIPTNHFSFQVSGLGATSGAVVNTNQGDYWLAVDGQYIVKYTLIVETSMSSDSDVFHEEISIDMVQVNKPVNITFPQGCQDASLVTPAP
jgi:hypothetical protein